MNTIAPNCAVKPILYGYWRSSCSWRVRIALHLKGIDFEQRIINLLKGEHKTVEFNEKLPFCLVPTLVHDEIVLGESLAIMEYLEEKFPDRQTLLPGTIEDRAKIRSLCLQIVANTQPLQNLTVIEYFSEDPAKRKEWAKHWIERSFCNLEKQLAKYSGTFAYGNQVSMLDCCIPPQVHNARRFGVDMAKFQIIERIDRNLVEIAEFKAADAFHQPDTPSDQKK